MVSDKEKQSLPQEPTLKEKTAKGLFWGGVSNGMQQVLGMLIGIVIARILNAGDYGLIGMLSIFSGIATILVDSGFTTALINKKEIKHEYFNAVFWFSTIVSIIIYFILFFSAPLIGLFFKKPQLVDLSRILFLGFLFSGTSIAHNAYLSKKIMAKERAKIEIISIVVSGLVGIILALKGLGYWSLAIQTVSYTLSTTILRWYYSPWQPSLQFNFEPVKKMFGFSSKIIITAIFNQININLFTVLLGRFYNERDTGNYYQGQKWMTTGQNFISGMINYVAHPVLSQISQDGNRQVAVLRKMLRFGAFISFPLMFGLAFAGKEFIVITIGEKWLPCVPFLQLLSFYGAFAFIWNLYTNLIISHGKSTIYMYGVIITGIIQLVFVVCMLPLGIFPMLGAYVSCYFISLIWWHFQVNRLILLEFSKVMKDILPYLFITLFSIFVSWMIIRNMENIYMVLFLKIAVTGIVYISLLWISNSKILKESLNYLFKK